MSFQCVSQLGNRTHKILFKIIKIIQIIITVTSYCEKDEKVKKTILAILMYNRKKVN